MADKHRCYMCMNWYECPTEDYSMVWSCLSCRILPQTIGEMHRQIHDLTDLPRLTQEVRPTCTSSSRPKSKKQPVSIRCCMCMRWQECPHDIIYPEIWSCVSCRTIPQTIRDMQSKLHNLTDLQAANSDLISENRKLRLSHPRASNR